MFKSLFAFAITTVVILNVGTAMASPPTAGSDYLVPAEWSTNRGLCGAECRAIKNNSKRGNCIGFGFSGESRGHVEGNLIITGDGRLPLGVLTPDGPDPDTLPDFKYCIPPGETVYGSVNLLGQARVQPNGETLLYLVMTSTAYEVAVNMTQNEYPLGKSLLLIVNVLNELSGRPTLATGRRLNRAFIPKERPIIDLSLNTVATR
ncbi:MAG: hypothetical protein WAZ14_01145 [Patescibacteria group bacterium]